MGSLEPVATRAVPAEEDSPFRWVIAGLLFAATFINYLDRQTFSIAAPLLARLFHLSNNDIANIILAFTLAYTIGQVVAGELIDALGTKLGFALMMLVWSIAGAATSRAGSVSGFSSWRFLLGLGEAGNWPASVKAVAEWFTARQRALGNAIFSAGSSAGAIAAPPLLAFLITRWGWQSAFIVTGASGLLWVALWLPLYRSAPLSAPARQPRAARVLRLLRYRSVWGLVLVRFFTDPVWWFYISWLPKYMADERGFALTDIAQKLWIPYSTSAFGGLASGALTSRLIRAGWSTASARKAVMTSAAVLMTAGCWVAGVGSADTALWLASIAVFGFYAFVVNTHAIVSDVFPTSVTASVSGISGLGAGVGFMIFTKIVGIVADRYSFGPVFVMAGLMPLVALIALFLLLGPARQGYAE